MFEEFYKFRENPFQLVPNPDFLFKSKNHQKALIYLEYGLMENVGIIVLTGEVGSGKTTTAQYILKNLGDGFDTAMIANTNITPLQMLRMIQSEFDIVSGETDKVTVIESLNRHFIAQYEAGKRTLLVIDEAQNISSQALEEVRMLSNLQSDQYALLQIILIGQPELLQTLKKHEMRQVNLLERVETLLLEERRKSEDFEQRLVKLEKKLLALSKLFEQLSKRHNDPSVFLTTKSIKNAGV